jgi:hypothetical protein
VCSSDCTFSILGECFILHIDVYNIVLPFDPFGIAKSDFVTIRKQDGPGPIYPCLIKSCI